MKKIILAFTMMTAFVIPMVEAQAETNKNSVAIHVTYLLPDKNVVVAQKDVVLTENHGGEFDVGFETQKINTPRYTNLLSVILSQESNTPASYDTRHYDLKIKSHEGNRFVIDVLENSIGYPENYLGELKNSSQLNAFQSGTLPAIYNYQFARTITVEPGKSFDMTPMLKMDGQGNFFEHYPGHLIFELVGG